MDRERTTYLTSMLRNRRAIGFTDEVTRLDPLMAGWSRQSYRATVEGSDSSAQHFIVRCKPDATLLDTDIEAEYDVFLAMQARPLPIPEVCGIDIDPDNAFGGPFFVMRFVEGEVYNIFSRRDQERLQEEWKRDRSIANDMVQYLTTIHQTESQGISDRVPRLRFHDVVNRWRAVYEERRILQDPVIEEAYRWLEDREPHSEWLGLVHGDFRIGNVIVDSSRVKAVLDWELAYVGDVRFDLGYLALARSAGKHLSRRSPLLGAFCDRNWFLGEYGEQMGRHIGHQDLRTFEMLGIMMVLATQLTATNLYASRATDDFRMAWGRFSVPGLRQDMIELMDW